MFIRLILLVGFCLSLILQVGLSTEAWGQQESERDPAAKPQRRATPAAQRRAAKPAVKKATTSNAPKLDADGEEAPGAIISKITIKGQKKIELDAVMARLVSKKGEPFKMSKIRQDIEALFKSGYFYDVKVDREAIAGGTLELIYTLVEKPSIVEIAFEGNSEVSTDDLREALGIKAYEILNMGRVREATDKMQKLYEDKGFFLARITTKVETVTEGESVKLTFVIQENDKVKVKRITFLGNKNLADGRLKDVMQTKEGGFFSFISGSGAYKQEAFDNDVIALGYYYFNEGYVQAKIERPQIYVTPDKTGIYITIRIEEGERFKVGTVDFGGDLLFDRDDLFGSIEIKSAEWYKHQTVLADIRSLTAKYGDLGYAYVNVIPRMKTRESEKMVDIMYEIDKGNKVYFGRINVVGNHRTRDKVLRRELAIREGELYNETRKRESMDNVRRLGFFEEVNFNSSTPQENPDLMNIDIVVKERNTGQLQVGAGYATQSGFIFNGSVSEINFLGRGQRLAVELNTSTDRSVINLSFTEPYVNDTPWSLGVDAYKTFSASRDASVAAGLDNLIVDETRKGAAVRVGYPLAPYLRGYLKYNLESIEGHLGGAGDPAIYRLPSDTEPNPVGNGNGMKSSATLTLEYDKRNDRWSPSKGIYSSAGFEYAGLGGDKRFTRGIFSFRYFYKVLWEIVWRNNFTYGFVRSNNNDPVPFNELFQAGGNDIRGYYPRYASQRVFSSRRYGQLTSGANPISGAAAMPKSMLPYGGLQYVVLNTEFEFPLVAEVGFKGVVFYDIGEADDSLRPSELRNNVGFGVRWFSPIGPLRFEWGIPLDRRPELDDVPVFFNFQIGSPF